MSGSNMVVSPRPGVAAGSVPSSPAPASRGSSLFGSFRISVRESNHGGGRQHDDEFSVSSDYHYGSANDLGVWAGAALLTADCLGTGVLALPNDIRVLGTWFGVGFLILNLPINLYAGTILSYSAGYVERKQRAENKSYSELALLEDDSPTSIQQEGIDDSDKVADEEDVLRNAKSPLHSRKLQKEQNYNSIDTEEDDVLIRDASTKHDTQHSLHHDTATFDFIGMTSALFHKSQATKWVVFLFYTNLFLVLGDYILVMSHAVSALFGESWLCIPTAGIIASTLMFAVSQLRTMANLGRSVSIMSLTALFIVVFQCLYFGNQELQEKANSETASVDTTILDPSEFTFLRKLSAMGSIGFATGSQKLLLNIRHEFGNRNDAPKSLAIALAVFGTFYVAVVLMAGPNPPGFLFDAIPQGIQRRLAGFLLWVHVVVSYAINSQAICASMDRIFFYQWAPVKELPDYQRWMILTAFISLSAFLVANAIPFFKDLVALIGALTSIPLTLLLPAIYHRKILGVSILLPTKDSVASYSLLVFATLFMVAGLVGSVNSILSDWKHHEGGFFSCH